VWIKRSPTAYLRMLLKISVGSPRSGDLDLFCSILKMVALTLVLLTACLFRGNHFTELPAITGDCAGGYAGGRAGGGIDNNLTDVDSSQKLIRLYTRCIGLLRYIRI